MSDTSTTTGLSSLIAQYGTDSAKISAGVATDSTTSSSDSSIADQDVFLQLYIAQLENQDPTSPQETGDMVSQMAEFSSLEQLTSIAEGIETMSEALLSSQALTASTLVGNYVYVEQDTTTISEDGGTYIKTTIPDDSVSTSLSVYDSDGNLVNSASFGDDGYLYWDGTDSDGNAVEEGEYTFVATSTNSSGEVTSLTVEIPSRINGVTINGTDGTTLNVAGYGTLELTDELEILG